MIALEFIIHLTIITTICYLMDKYGVKKESERYNSKQK